MQIQAASDYGVVDGGQSARKLWREVCASEGKRIRRGLLRSKESRVLWRQTYLEAERAIGRLRVWSWSTIRTRSDS